MIEKKHIDQHQHAGGGTEDNNGSGALSEYKHDAAQIQDIERKFRRCKKVNNEDGQKARGG